MNAGPTTMRRVVTPNETISKTLGAWIVAAWSIGIVAVWSAIRPAILPSPAEVLASWPTLWFRDGLGHELISSLRVNVEALLLSTALALPLAYVSLTPILRPAAVGLSKLRFLSPAVFFLMLLLLVGGGHQVKVLMLALGEMFFLLTTMLTVVDALPTARFDDARTLRLSEWQVTWYVVVRGTVAEALDAIRDNAAIGWSMLLMVEGIVRGEGGVGVLLLNQEKHFNFAEVYAIAMAIIVVGWGQDAILRWIRRGACPYARPS